MIVLDHVPLRDRCSLSTGGVAEYYCAVHSLQELIEALQYSLDQQITARVMGKGTGLLVSDGGVQGLVIQNQSSDIVFVHDRSQVIVDSGFPVSRLAAQTMSNGYSGLEFLLAWPGTVGGALYRNAAAFGQSIGDYVKAATLSFVGTQDTKEPIRRVERDWFRFTHNGSRLKEGVSQDDVSPVILSVTFQLSKMNPSSCLTRGRHYHALWQSSAIPPLPHLQLFDQLTIDTSADRSHESKIRVSSALIRQWKKGDVMISSSNPNFVIHRGMGTSGDVEALTAQIRSDVSGQGSLEVCFEYLGQW